MLERPLIAVAKYYDIELIAVAKYYDCLDSCNFQYYLL